MKYPSTITYTSDDSFEAVDEHSICNIENENGNKDGKSNTNTNDDDDGNLNNVVEIRSSVEANVVSFRATMHEQLNKLETLESQTKQVIAKQVSRLNEIQAEIRRVNDLLVTLDSESAASTITSTASINDGEKEEVKEKNKQPNCEPEIVKHGDSDDDNNNAGLANNKKEASGDENLEDGAHTTKENYESKQGDDKEEVPANNQGKDPEVASNNDVLTSNDPPKKKESKPNNELIAERKVGVSVFTPPIQRKLNKLKTNLTNKFAYLETKAIVKSWLALKARQEQHKVQPLLCVWNSGIDINDTNAIGTEVAKILKDIGTINNNNYCWKNTRDKDKLNDALDKAEGGVLSLFHMFYYFKTEPTYIESVMETAERKNVYLIFTEDRANISKDSFGLNNNESLQTKSESWHLRYVDFEKHEISEFTRCFELLVKVDGFNADEGLLEFVEKMIRDKNIHIDKTAGTLEAATKFWDVVWSVHDEHVLQKMALPDTITLADVGLAVSGLCGKKN